MLFLLKRNDGNNIRGIIFNFSSRFTFFAKEPLERTFLFAQSILGDLSRSVISIEGSYKKNTDKEAWRRAHATDATPVVKCFPGFKISKQRQINETSMSRANAITDYLYLGGIADVRKDFLVNTGISLIINGINF